MQYIIFTKQTRKTTNISDLQDTKGEITYEK